MVPSHTDADDTESTVTDDPIDDPVFGGGQVPRSVVEATAADCDRDPGELQALLVGLDHGGDLDDLSDPDRQVVVEALERFREDLYPPRREKWLGSEVTGEEFDGRATVIRIWNPDPRAILSAVQPVAIELPDGERRVAGLDSLTLVDDGEVTDDG